MQLIEFYQEDQNYYNDFAIGQPHSPFLQSWAWGEFQRHLEKKVWRLGVKQGNSLIAVAQIIAQPLRLGKTYLYIPRGPLFMPGLSQEAQQEAIELLLSKARDICQATSKEKEIFVRLEPDLSCREDALLPLPLLKTTDVQPRETLVLDLTSEEKILLKNLHHKTRYNINLAERRGVKIRQTNNPQDLNKFLTLAKITAARAGFKIWPDKYYRGLFETLNRQQMISLWLAEYKERTVVANLVVNYGDTVTYLHGGSANKNKEVMAPHLLQWQQILWAKEHGYTFYDFWGIASASNTKAQAWQGITRFKQGFGGRETRYLGSYDHVYATSWYAIYNFFRRLR